MAEYKYNTIEEALESLRQGKIILVTDDEDRENEGDMISAGEFATQANINFMACYAKGLICTPMSGELAAKLGLYPMVTKNTDNHETAFTVSIDHVDTTTGISAAERPITPMGCVAADAKPVIFGDLSYYWIGDRQGVTFKRLNERYADMGQVGFLASKRVDGKLVLPEAIKVLKMKTAASG